MKPQAQTAPLNRAPKTHRVKFGDLLVGDRFIKNGRIFHKTLLVNHGSWKYNATTDEKNGRAYILLLSDKTIVKAYAASQETED